jgi:hypothetical protein
LPRGQNRKRAEPTRQGHGRRFCPRYAATGAAPIAFACIFPETAGGEAIDKAGCGPSRADARLRAARPRIFLGHTFIVTREGRECVDNFPLEIAVANG